MTLTKFQFSSDPVIDLYKKDIDITLLRQNLSFSATERLERLQQLLEFATELKQAGSQIKSNVPDD